MVKFLEELSRNRNIKNALKDRKRETKELLKIVSEDISNPKDYVIDAYLKSIDSYRNGLDFASIFYGGMAVELGLILKLNKNNNAISKKFYQLIESAKKTGILKTDKSVENARKVEYLRNLYVHPQNLLKYLYRSAESELYIYGVLYEFGDMNDRKWWLKHHRRTYKYIEEEYKSRKDAFSKLKDFSNVQVDIKTDAFIKKQIEEYYSFTYRRYHLLSTKSADDKNYKLMVKAQKLSNTLESGDSFGVFDITRFNAVNQLVWVFNVLEVLGLFKHKYAIFHDQVGFSNHEIYIRKDWRDEMR